MTDEQDRQALALFRYGLIAELAQLPAVCVRRSHLAAGMMIAEAVAHAGA